MATLNNLKILHKRYTTEDWANHTLDAGEFGLDLTTFEVKVGTSAAQPWAEAHTVGVEVQVTGEGSVITNAQLVGSKLTITKGKLSYNDLDDKPEIPVLPEHIATQVKAEGDNVAVDATATTTGEGVATVKVTHKSLGPEAGYTSANTTTEIKTAGEDITLKIPQITVDERGHVTAASDQDVTVNIPVDKDTTYTIAPGNNPGEVKLTPSSGEATTIKLAGWDALVEKVNGRRTAYTYESKEDPLYTEAVGKTGSFEVGDTIYFKTLSVADQWVSKVNEEDPYYEFVDIETEHPSLDGYVRGTALSADAVIVGKAGSEVKALANGTDGQVLKMVDGKPAWGADTDTKYTADKGLSLTGTAIGHSQAAVTATNKAFGVFNFNEYGHITGFTAIDTLDGNDSE